MGECLKKTSINNTKARLSNTTGFCLMPGRAPQPQGIVDAVGRSYFFGSARGNFAVVSNGVEERKPDPVALSARGIKKAGPPLQVSPDFSISFNHFIAHRGARRQTPFPSALFIAYSTFSLATFFSA